MIYIPCCWLNVVKPYSKAVLRPSNSRVGYGRIQIRSSFHSRRGPRKPGLEPDPLEHLKIESGPLHAKGLVRPLLFSIGVWWNSIYCYIIFLRVYKNVKISQDKITLKSWIFGIYVRIGVGKNGVETVTHLQNHLMNVCKVPNLH